MYNKFIINITYKTSKLHFGTSKLHFGTFLVVSWLLKKISIICLFWPFTGRYVPLLDIRRHIFSLCGTLTASLGSKAEKLRSHPQENADLKAIFKHPDSKVLPDPSQFLSFETCIRPTRRQKERNISQSHDKIRVILEYLSREYMSVCILFRYDVIYIYELVYHSEVFKENTFFASFF